MEVKKYRMARSWLTDPDSGNSAGQWKNFVQQRAQEWKTRQGFKGAGLVEHGPAGVRQGYAEKYLSNSEFAELYKKFPGGTDTEFAGYLKSLKKQAKGELDFTAPSVEKRRKRLNIKSKAPPIYGASKTMASFKKEAKELGIDIKGLDDQTIKNKVRNRREDLTKQKRRLTDPEWAKKDAAAKKAWAERNPEKVKETLFKTKQKIYLEKGIPPPAQNAKEELWRSLFKDGQNYEKGRRLKTVGNYGTYISRDQLLNAEILDTKTGKKITFKNLEKYINPKNTGKTYAEVIKSYNQKWFVNETPGLRNEINSKLIKNWTKGDKRNWFEIQHNAGRYNDPFDVSLSNKGVNLKESQVRTKFEKMWNASDSLSDKKKAFRFYKENLPNEILSKPSMVTRSRYFGTEIPLDEQLRAVKAEGVRLPKGTLKAAAKPPMLGSNLANVTADMFDFRKLPGDVRHFADIAARYGAKSPALMNVLKKAKGVGKWTGIALATEPLWTAPFAGYEYMTGESPERMWGTATWGLKGETAEEEIRKATGELGYGAQQIEDYGSTLSALEENYKTLNDKNDPRGEKRKTIENAFERYRGKYNKVYDLFVDESGEFNEDLYEQGLNNYTAGLVQIDKFKEQLATERQEKLDEWGKSMIEPHPSFIKEQGLPNYQGVPDWDVIAPTARGYAGGGMTGIRRPDAVPPKSGPDPQGEGLSYLLNRVRKE